MKRNFEVIVIAILLRNGRKADYGEKVTEEQLPDTPDKMILNGYIKEIVDEKVSLAIEASKKAAKAAKEVEEADYAKANANTVQQKAIEAAKKAAASAANSGGVKSVETKEQTVQK